MPKRLRTVRPSEVFLSHSSRDRNMAARIVDVLVAHGIRVWYSPAKLTAAQQWHDQIGKALARCDWFVLLMSPAANRSRWVKRELVYALNKERYEEKIIPVLYQACKVETLSWTLPGFQNVDLTGDFETGCQALLKTWGVSYHGP